MTEHERGVLLTSMSDDTAAMVLGRSAAWVKRKRGELAGRVAVPPIPAPRTPPPPPPPVVPTPPPAPPLPPLPEPGLEARLVRWIGWFRDARWAPAEVARLFDLDMDELLTAVPDWRAS
ncbi:MAG: hypothetical protein ACK4FB_08925 [Brevundimonas sp.]|uniref:hypothetical protein n=1 Tax=Brevundimonas sp. TaxID=1871086 RepID=UPI00391BF66A